MNGYDLGHGTGASAFHLFFLSTPNFYDDAVSLKWLGQITESVKAGMLHSTDQAAWCQAFRSFRAGITIGQLLLGMCSGRPASHRWSILETIFKIK
jgi:hypothetical protein